VNAWNKAIPSLEEINSSMRIVSLDLELPAARDTAPSKKKSGVTIRALAI